MQVVKDEVMPKGKWEFDGDVTTAFDDMLARSIPQYEVMRKLCFDLACKYQKRNTHIVDLGCSRGEAMADLVYEYGINNQFVGVEISEPMRRAAINRFQGLIPTCVNIKDIDLRNDYPPVAASVTLCVLTLQFTPIEYRLKILKNIYDHVIDGGALIIVEKVLGSSAKIDANMVDIYYEMKRANGYTEDQIQRKRLSLEGVLVPLTARWNEEMLQMAGFNEVDCFWRWMNFGGWIAIK
jgi:tRNA (cmo5U34)-methyltransferase